MLLAQKMISKQFLVYSKKIQITLNFPHLENLHLYFYAEKHLDKSNYRKHLFAYVSVCAASNLCFSK